MRSKRLQGSIVTALSVLIAGGGLGGAFPARGDSGAPEPPRVAFRLQDPTLTESSGLAVSRRHRGIVWTHNDGGSAALVFALDREGQTRAVLTLRGIDPFDPEALAPGRGARDEPVLFLGDIGDNRGVRSDVSIFRFVEPRRVVDQTVAADWYRLRYPDGPHDAEALLVNPRDGRVWIATKDLLMGGLYRAPARLSTQHTNLLERVADVPGLVTDGAFLPDGRFVLRSYGTAYVFELPARLVAEEALPSQQQGESLAVDGEELLVGSEGRGAEVYSVPVPRPVPRPVSRETSSSSSAAPSREPDQSRGTEKEKEATSPRTSTSEHQPIRIAAVGAAIVLALLLSLGFTRSRRARRRRAL